MIRVKIAELRDGLSRFLRSVERGEVVEVLDRTRPIARIVPAGGGDELRLTGPARPFSEVRQKRYPNQRLGYDVVDLLVEDRRRR